MRPVRATISGCLVALALLLPGPTASAQTVTVQIGGAGYGGGLQNPFDMYYPSTRSQCIYRIADINAAFTAAGLTPGNPVYIKSISYQSGYWYGGADPNYENLAIKMGTTAEDLNTWQNGPSQYISTAWTNVFTPKPYTFTATTNAWQKFNFDNIFYYTGGSNIILDQCTDRSGSYGSKYYTYWNYTQWVHAQWPPKITTLWSYGLTPTNGCSSTTGQNGYLYAFPVAQMEICTGQPATVDFSAPAFGTLPANVPVSYTVSHPTGSFNATITIRFYTPTGQLVQTQSTVVAIAANTVNGVVNVPTGSLTPGFYRIEVTFNVLNPCGALSDVAMNKVTMLLNPGQTPCVVWPGDANNDGIVNFGDRKALNEYIKNANLQSSWLTGPARYRADGNVNPLTYIAWEGQPSVPWSNSDGCFMDTDGNGMINNFDYLAMKINWMKQHGFVKQGDAAAMSFDMSQNYPNPFNPTTSIDFTTPEASQVTIVVTDMLGRTVSTLMNGQIAAGTHRANFDGASLNSGTYIATVMATGNESGQTFTKSIKMTLNK
ncbi:MAG: T9SS type A sorting domain-containing protein [Ignavibacteria bacterium]|nr:T9SS type A sorting domain-containing protein [Ignavibacteria bacterium]